MLCVTSGKFLMVKHLRLAKIRENHKSFSPLNDLTYRIAGNIDMEFNLTV